VYHRGTPKTKAKREAEAEADPDPEAHPHALPHLGRHKRGHAHHAHHQARDNNAVVTVTETAYITYTRSTTATGTSAIPAPASTTSSAATTAYAWARDSYYNAASGEADNVVFLNHLGGTAGSGVWDSCFGNSLSYANSDGATSAGAPTVLGQVTIPSDSEVVLFTSQQCGGDCGYVRPGTPAYSGFDTSRDTVFLLEFQMPHDGNTGFNGDMAAVWFLNAQIPRTLQYGNAACSCWTSGCGELDVFEILSSGSNYCTSTLHSWQGTGTQYGGGGCADYINRPISGPMQAAIILNNEAGTVNIVVLPENVNFSQGLTNDQVNSWTAIQGSDVNIA
jgi:Putative TOS1-like glycosyl hydrolase (DUF2401)